MVTAAVISGCHDDGSNGSPSETDNGLPVDIASVGWPDLGPAEDVFNLPDVGPVTQPDTVPDDLADVPFVSTGTCDDGTVRFAAVRAWPGGGIQCSVVLRTPDLEPVTDISQQSLAFLSPDGQTWPAAVAPAFKEPAIIGVLLDESPDPQRRSAQKNAINALVQTLWSSDRVVLWRTGPSLELLSDLTSDKSHITHVLGSVATTAVSVDTAHIWTVTKLLGQELLPFGSTNRWLIVVSDAAQSTAGLPTGSHAALPVVWFGASDSAAPGSAHLTLDQDGVLSGQQAGLWIHQQRFGLHRIGACVDAPEGSPLALRIGDTTCPLIMPEPMAHMAAVPCSAEAAAADDYPYGTTINLDLNVAEKVVWDQYHKDNSTEDMTLKVRVGSGAAIDAVAHFRGQTSLTCARKSLSVNLKGSDKRRLAPMVSGDEFYLISMCKDDGYFNQVFADRLMYNLGIFPLGFRYVKVFLNGENQGVYFLLADVADTLVDSLVTPTAVLRRRFDPEDEPVEVKYPDDSAGVATAIAQYSLLMDTVIQTPADDLLSTLSARMDLDGYLRWLAFNSLFYNGDYVDEAYFYASRETAGGWYFRFMGWDPDDLFSSCHHGGKWALLDPNGILYCAEADLDVALIRSPAVYARFVEWVAHIAQHDLAQPVLEQVMDEVKTELFMLLNDDETATAMVELHSQGEETKTAMGAQQKISTMMADMLKKADERRTKLLNKAANIGVVP